MDFDVFDGIDDEHNDIQLLKFHLKQILAHHRYAFPWNLLDYYNRKMNDRYV